MVDSSLIAGKTLKTDRKPTSMTKHKTLEIQIDGLPSTTWFRAEECSHDENGILIESGDIFDAYLLDSPAIHDQLLKDFSEIEDEDSAFNWVEQYGMPVDCQHPFGIQVGSGGGVSLDSGEMLIEEIVLAARDIRWLQRLSQLLKARDSARLSQYTYIWKDIPAKYESNPCTWWPTSSGFDPRIHRIVFDREELQRGLNFRPTVRKGRESKYAFLFYPGSDAEWGGVFDLRRVRCPLHPRLVWLVGSSGVNSLDDLVLMACAIFLTSITDWIMEGSIRPSTSLALVDGAPVIRPTMLAASPWAAVRLAFYQELLAASSLRICPHPECGKTFVATRKDKKCCGDEKCQKYVTRLKKQGLEV